MFSIMLLESRRACGPLPDELLLDSQRHRVLRNDWFVTLLRERKAPLLCPSGKVRILLSGNAAPLVEPVGIPVAVSGLEGLF